jgi:hypothetical protein
MDPGPPPIAKDEARKLGQARNGQNSRLGAPPRPRDDETGKLAFASGGPLQHFPEAVRYRGTPGETPSSLGVSTCSVRSSSLEAAQLFHDL